MLWSSIYFDPVANLYIYFGIILIHRLTLLYTATAKESLKRRNTIFLNKGMLLLLQIGFEKSPLSKEYLGKNNIGGYSYDLCRLTKDSLLQMFTTH